MLQVAELTHLGLTDTEAHTYLALLELGVGTVSSITHRAGITRTLGYPSLTRLMDLDLIEQKNNSHPAKFHVKHPKQIIQYVEKQKQVWADRVSMAQNLLPKLESSYTMLGRPFLSNRVGKEEVLDLYRILYTSENRILSLLNPTRTTPDILRELCTIKNSGAVSEKITCILDTEANRHAIVTNGASTDHIRWIDALDTPFDSTAIEVLITGDTLYTLTDQNGEIAIESITHESTVRGMYTLLYTFIHSQSVSRETTVN